MAKNNIPESQTINQLGSGTVIKGDIKSNGDFRIDGTLIGTIESKGKIVIGTSGNVEGEITCQNAVISGSIKVKINVAELIELKSSSKFSGEIITNKLAIEPGAKFSGTCNMSDPGLKEIKPLVKNDPIKEKST
ncbi:MAG: polymer-forming cytoskeletal protein [Bacteroidetes bacterium]|nr:polymer-forming cytoskeletal protein [Bacteroidota bacterium]